jgi:hypothetical protein
VSLTGSTGTRAFVFGTNPTFRAHPIGAYSDIARAIFWAAGQGTPVAPPASVIEADLVDGTRGSVSLPETAVPGETVTVELGSDLTDAEPSALVFPGGSSLPLSDVTATSARLTIPADAEPGARRIAIVRGDGSLYGWDDLRVAVPGPTPTPTASPEPTVSPEPTASPEPTVSPEPSASAQPTGGLAATGGAGTGQLGWGALAVGLIGLGTILIARARTTSRSS